MSLEERAADGSLLARYVYGHDLLSRTDAVGTMYYHTDDLGSVVKVTDQDMNVVAGYDYESYGRLGYSAGPRAADNTRRYTGEEWDPETGFYYFDCHPGRNSKPCSEENASRALLA